MMNGRSKKVVQTKHTFQAKAKHIVINSYQNTASRSRTTSSIGMIYVDYFSTGLSVIVDGHAILGNGLQWQYWYSEPIICVRFIDGLTAAG